MSTALWLCENSWEQRCCDCDFYLSCTQSTDDPCELNDCDEFCHDEEDE